MIIFILTIHFNIISVHKPVTSDELFAAFETAISRVEFTAFRFTEAFKSWEDQKGFPLLNVGVNIASGVFELTQQRYYAASEERVENDQRSWFIPLNFATKNNPNFLDTLITNYFEPGSPLKMMPLPAFFDSTQWVIFNKQQIGYYRVNYETNNWNLLSAVLNSPNFNEIHVVNRAQLIEDSLSLAADGYLTYDIAFKILNYLERETDYIPWRAAVTNLDKIDYLLKGRGIYENYRTFIRKLARKMYVTYGLDEKPGDSIMDKFARELAIDWTCRMGDQRCLDETYARMKKIALENEAIPASLELTVICNGLKGLNRQEEFAALWRRMQASNDQAERLLILDGLMCTSDPKAFRDLLETTLVNTNEAYYRQHELTRIINNAFVRSPTGLTAMMDFVAEFRPEITSR